MQRNFWFRLLALIIILTQLSTQTAYAAGPFDTIKTWAGNQIDTLKNRGATGIDTIRSVGGTIGSMVKDFAVKSVYQDRIYGVVYQKAILPAYQQGIYGTVYEKGIAPAYQTASSTINTIGSVGSAVGGTIKNFAVKSVYQDRIYGGMYQKILLPIYQTGICEGKSILNAGLLGNKMLTNALSQQLFVGVFAKGLYSSTRWIKDHYLAVIGGACIVGGVVLMPFTGGTSIFLVGFGTTLLIGDIQNTFPDSKFANNFIVKFIGRDDPHDRRVLPLLLKAGENGLMCVGGYGALAKGGIMLLANKLVSGAVVNIAIDQVCALINGKPMTASDYMSSALNGGRFGLTFNGVGEIVNAARGMKIIGKVHQSAGKLNNAVFNGAAGKVISTLANNRVIRDGVTGAIINTYFSISDSVQSDKQITAGDIKQAAIQGAVFGIVLGRVSNIFSKVGETKLAAKIADNVAKVRSAAGAKIGVAISGIAGNNLLRRMIMEETGAIRLGSHHEIGQAIGEHGHKIDGGISTGRGPREILEVNFSEDKALQKMYQDASTEAAKKMQAGMPKEKAIVQSVYESVKKNVPNNGAREEFLRKRYVNQKLLIGEAVDSPKIMDAKGGLCRHQGICASALLERFIKNGDLNGRVSYNRGPGHGWSGYESHTGESFVLDVAQGYYGPMQSKKFEGTGGLLHLYADYMPQEFKKAISDVKSNPRFAGLFDHANNLGEIVKTLDDLGGLQGSSKFYSSAELRSLIGTAQSAVRSGANITDALSYITRTSGLRDKVIQLLNNARLAQ